MSDIDVSGYDTEAGVVAELTHRALIAMPLYDRAGGAPVVSLKGDPVDLERYAAQPFQVRADVEFHDIDSLVAYGTEFYPDEDATGITRAYLDRESVKLTVLFDDDRDREPQWRRHRAWVDFVYSEDWVRWIGVDRQVMEQSRFAEFLEDNVAAVVDPTAADILEMVSNFESVTTTTFKSAKRLQDGRRELIYREDGVGDLSVTVPQSFRIGVPVFKGIDQAYAITARLKYRARNGEVTFCIELERIDLVLEAAFGDLAERFEVAHEGFVGFAPQVLRGRPPAAR